MIIDASEISPKSEMKTVILALLFRGFGLHRFYVGKYLSGMIYVLIGSTSFISSVCDKIGVSFFQSVNISLICMFIAATWALFDIFALYSESFTDGQGRLIVSKATKEENGYIDSNKSHTPVADIILLFAIYFIYVDMVYIILPELY